MATLKTQVDDLIGSGIASTVYNEWLKAGARSLVDLFNQGDLESHSVSVAVPITTGLTTASQYRIWRVTIGGYDATQYPAGYETQIVDTNSLHKSSVFTPAYIINAGTLKCYNGANIAGTLLGCQYDTGVDSTADSEIPNFPDQLQYAVVLYAAILGRQNQITTLIASMATAISASLTSLPTPLVSSLDLTAHLSVLNTYVVTTEDIELAQAKIAEIQTLLANWLQNTAGEIKIELEQSVMKLSAELQTMGTKISSYGAQMQTYNASATALQAEYNKLVQLYTGGK